ncbi:hypothetical protein V1477_020014 [Vespula maculifrons]|uniref:Uncharacterized protein n=1 Tax=Vespula maculifrons TaxID=7453 RepID=A0ABD2AKR4_VESMC
MNGNRSYHENPYRRLHVCEERSFGGKAKHRGWCGYDEERKKEGGKEEEEEEEEEKRRRKRRRKEEKEEGKEECTRDRPRTFECNREEEKKVEEDEKRGRESGAGGRLFREAIIRHGESSSAFAGRKITRK